MLDASPAIRCATEHDFEVCIDIARAAWPAFNERPSIYHLLCKHFNNTCFVAELDGIPKSFLLGFLSQSMPSAAYIHLVATHPSVQRSGCATLLYQRFFSVVRAFNCTTVHLIVNPDNEKSMRFHEQLGFVTNNGENTILIDKVLATRNYNGEGIHMVPFIKRL